MPSLRTALTVLGATALLGGLGTPAYAQSSAGDYPTDSGSSQSDTSGKHTSGKKKAGKKGKRARHRRGARRLSQSQLTAVAEKLGTTLAKLKEAQSEVKAAVKASEERETRSEIDAMLAEKLGVTATEVRAAFDSVRPARSTSGKRGGCKRKSSESSGSDESTAGSYPSDSAAS